MDENNDPGMLVIARLSARRRVLLEEEINKLGGWDNVSIDQYQWIEARTSVRAYEEKERESASQNDLSKNDEK